MGRGREWCLCSTREPLLFAFFFGGMHTAGCDGWIISCLWLVCALLTQVMVAEGGVLHLVHGLVHPDLAVSCCCSEMLARLASTHQQQPLQAIRCVCCVAESPGPDPDTLRSAC